MRALMLFLVSSVFVLGLSGCATMSGGAQSEYLALEPSTMFRFEDIPHPAGFKLLTDKSFILESGDMRAGILNYTGKADPESVVMFYKSQMPIYNWALLNTLEYGEHMLNFERQNESCVVTVKSKGRRINITISLAPKSPVPLPEKEPFQKEESVKTYQGK